MPTSPKETNSIQMEKKYNNNLNQVENSFNSLDISNEKCDTQNTNNNSDTQNTNNNSDTQNTNNSSDTQNTNNSSDTQSIHNENNNKERDGSPSNDKNENNNEPATTVKPDIIYVSSELDLIKEFFNQIRLLDPDIIIGYNILGFDYRYITRRAGIYLKEEFNASRIINKNTEFNDLLGSDIVTEIFFPGRLNIDMYHYAKTLNLPVSSLNYVSEKLFNKKKIDLPYKEMFKLIQCGDETSLQKVAHYCIVDSELTMDIFDVSHQWIQLLEIAKISRIRIDEVYKTGQSIKFTNLLYQYCHQNDICINLDSAGVNDYHGATVLEPTPGVYNLCSMLDFTSLYPSIIITHNICYTTLITEEEVKKMNKEDYHEIHIDEKTYYYTKQHVGILPRMMKVLLTERVKFKTLMKTAHGIDKIIYDKRQWALKIQANSIYGCLGSKSLKFLRFLPGAECTTGMGRNYLNRAIQLIQETPFDIIYGDTDSCLVKCDIIKETDLFIQNSKRIAQYVTDNLPEGMHLKYENTFSRLIIISKKKYSGILVNTEDNKFYTKGMDTVKKNNSQFIRDSYQTLIKMIFDGQSSKKVKNYILQLKSDLFEGRIPNEQLTMKLTINKKYKNKSFYVLQFLAYHRKHNLDYKVGEKIDFLIVTSLLPKETNAKKLGDKIISIDLYKHIQENDPQNLPVIDYNYYYTHYIRTSFSLLLKAFDPSLLNYL
ncbi:hypothetical protein PIROE2DRAFT_58479 [Piromyces sp. E2]|nr:hypothetical protein PIROE2DRAFT_58479 [Piromyces sp. E2]|eukprot:OUM67887.1 hypothetical protein PIROE2DRAFT_58479 [Piromyces sp. E2]